MSIVYVQFEVSVHGLSFESETEMEVYRLQLKSLIEECHPAGFSNIMDNDVEVEITEHAGTPNV